MSGPRGLALPGGALLGELCVATRHCRDSAMEAYAAVSRRAAARSVEGAAREPTWSPRRCRSWWCTPKQPDSGDVVFRCQGAATGLTPTVNGPRPGGLATCAQWRRTRSRMPHAPGGRWVWCWALPFLLTNPAFQDYLIY